ncbi:MAG: DNA polymerase III subunit beta [Candidatus Eremiobacteraeota bacterium]|nr:DNA polymerase III subunit beta [Candidatus Eremiobacteraeota bacterium]MBV9264174.1 DNA polymerase III subunit beta [Candidatus Eremiobacteraeota bacterium]
MKFSCTTKDIAAAVGAASKVVNAHTTVPVLSNVLLQADDGKIAVRATDLELTLQYGFAAEISERGEVTVPAKLFASYLGNLAPGRLEFTGTPTRASVKYERSNYDFHALPADEYPPLPAAARGAQFAMGTKRFREAIEGTIFAASSEEARGAVLMGTLLEIEGNALTLVATDGYRLSKFSTTLDEGISGAEKFIVPSRALAEAARNLSVAERVEVNALGAQSNQLQMSAGDVAITVRLVDGQYPNYQQVIPAKFDRSVTVSTSQLVGSLRRAELVAGDRASMVKLSFANQTLILTASSDTSGNAYEELEVEQTGEDLTIAFNARYLIEILNHVKSDRTVMEFLGPLSPAAIRPLEPNEGAQQLYVLMPLRQ